MTDEKKDEYPLTPMHKHFKEVVCMQLSREPQPAGQQNGKIHRMKWLFQPIDFPCGSCNSSDHVKFMILPTGVYRSCEYCNITEKVEAVNYENGQEAILLEDLILTDNRQAVEVIKRYGQEKLYLNEETRVFLPEHHPPRHPNRKPRKD
jgi:hypothetical protein